jgi:hypothetical protein
MTEPVPVCQARIREAGLDDYGQIAQLQSRNGLSTRSNEEWRGLWTRNPAYTKSPGNGSIGWAIEDGAGAIVGFVGNLPLAYRWKGREVRAATAYSWVVDAAYRGYSLLLLDRMVKQPSVDLIVCTTVNAIAAKAYDAFQFSRVPAGSWDRSGFWITDHRAFARSALRSADAPFSRALAYPVSAALWLCGRLTKTPGRHGSFELCNRFDERFDRFWRELEDENPGRLLAVRDRESLEWHFGGALARGDAWMLAAVDGGRIVAYAIFDRKDHPAIELKRLRIVDFQALRGSDRLLRPAIAWLLRKCRSEGVHIAEHSGGWLDRLGIEGTAAPFRRKLKSWLFYYKARGESLARQLQDPNVWAPSSFDGDASL